MRGAWPVSGELEINEIDHSPILQRENMKG